MKRYKSIFMVAGLAALALSGCRGSSDSVSDGTAADVSSNDKANQSSESAENATEMAKGDLKLVSMSEIRAAAESFSDTYDKLDFSEAVFNIPEVDTVSKLTYGADVTEAEQFDDMEEKLLLNMAHMGGSDDYETLRYRMVQSEDDLYTKASVIDSKERSDYHYLVYNDGQYVALITWSGVFQASDNMFWMGLCGNSDKMNEEFSQPWYAGFEESEEIAAYNLPEDSIEGVSYELFDGETLLSDAVEFVEEDSQNYFFASTDYEDAEVGEVYVYQTAEGACYYDFYMRFSMDGIEIKDYSREAYGYNIMESGDELGFTRGSIKAELTMPYSDGINFIWSYGVPNHDEVKEEVTEFVSLEDAADIVDESISEDASFNITDVTMAYHILDYGYHYDGDYWHDDYHQVRLTYLFHVDNPGVLGYAGLYFCVDAESGQFYTLAKPTGY